MTKKSIQLRKMYLQIIFSVLWLRAEGDCVFIQLSTLSGVQSLKQAHYRYIPHDLTPDWLTDCLLHYFSYTLKTKSMEWERVGLKVSVGKIINLRCLSKICKIFQVIAMYLEKGSSVKHLIFTLFLALFALILS